MQDLIVADAMHRGIITADPGASALTLAATMARESVHCLLVDGIERDRYGEHAVWGIVTDMDLLAALHAGGDIEAGHLAATEVVSVSDQLPLPEAVAVMVEHDLSHLVVFDESDGRPCGVLSSLDVARVTAEGATAEA